MTINEMRTAYGRLMTEAQTISLAGFTTESREKFDRVMTDANALFADIQRSEQVEKAVSEMRNTVTPPRSLSNEIEPDFKLQKRALQHYMLTGQVAPEFRGAVKGFHEQRDLGTGTDSGIFNGDAGVTVPTGFNDVLNNALLSYGQIASAVGQMHSSDGRSIIIPGANDTGNSVTVIGQGAANSEVDPTFVSLTSLVDTLTSGTVTISNELLQDSAFDLASWIQTQFGTRLARGLAAFVVNGNSSNITALTATSGATSAAPTAITYTDLATLGASVDNAYGYGNPNAKWVMNSATRGNLVGQVSTTGTPILQPSVQGTPFSSLLGKDIVIAEAMPSIAATHKAVYFGDLSQYTLRSAGVGIKRLNELLALQNLTSFVLYARYGGFNNPLGSGIAPVKALTQHA